MELPAQLRQAVDSALAGVPISDLTAAAKALSQRYRDEVRDGRLHISDDRLALAYIATRMPATYAAIHAALAALAEQQPDFAPRSLLDVGAGPGTVMWAAADLWPDMEAATLIETSPAIRALGERLAAGSSIAAHQLARRRPARRPAGRPSTISSRWPMCSTNWRQRIATCWSIACGAVARHVLLIVEPGTTAGWRRILDARAQLIAEGAHILAPCPHALTCPIAEPDWCHFSARVARSRIHRLAKEAEVPWEDEKFIYLAAVPRACRAARPRACWPRPKPPAAA